MSPVNRAGSVSEISPRHSFLRKNFDVLIWEAGLVAKTEISITGMKMFPYEHSRPGNQDETF